MQRRGAYSVSMRPPTCRQELSEQWRGTASSANSPQVGAPEQLKERVVRVRDHIVLSTAGMALLYRWAGRRVLGAWVGSIFIDVDHYLWFCWRQRTIDPLAALRFFNMARPPHHPGTRLFHTPPVSLAVLLLGARRQGAVPVGLGMILHVAMDAYHETRMGEARAAALRRDHA